MVSLQVNQAPIEYWQRTGFSREDLLKVCQEIDRHAMAACVSFEDNNAVNVRVTENTWNRQEGHYPTIAKFYGDLGLHPQFNSARGAVIVWMDDGLWVPWQRFAARAPIADTLKTTVPF